jgi:uncharacterized protein
VADSRRVAFAQAAWEAFNRRDFDALLDFVHPEIEWIPAQGPGGMEGSVYRGAEAFERWAREELDELWSGFHAEDLEIRDLGERVLTLGRVRGRGRASGVEVDAEFAQLWELKDGRIARMEAFFTHADALAAAGLQH